MPTGVWAAMKARVKDGVTPPRKVTVGLLRSPETM